MPLAIQAQAVLHVDTAAPVGGDGLTWATAYSDVQDALADVATNGDACEIWVAAGTYEPDRGTGDRAGSFYLHDGVAIYGGFTGTETERSQRDPRTYHSILSGDLTGDDGPNFTNNGDNSYHVVTADGVFETAFLDGFMITGGNAEGGESQERGGGLLIANEGSPTLINCRFVSNSAAGTGGGIYNFGGRPRLVNCVFVGNRSGGGGGGMYNFEYGDAVLTGCLFTGNAAGADGGGMYNYNGSSPTLVNCTFAANSGQLSGGLHKECYSSPTLLNCIFWGNTATFGTEEEQQIYALPCARRLVVNHSCIQGWTGTLGGVGNIGDDPRFADLDGDDNVAGTEDDDLTLSFNSPCIDRGDNEALPRDFYDLDGDGQTFEPIPHDLAGGGRLVDGRTGTGPVVDMGAYEFWRDCNSNGVSDLLDIAFGTSDDCASNGTPDECDLAAGTSTDCNANGVPDDCDIAVGTSFDCQPNALPDECDITGGTSADCNGNSVPDECETIEPRFLGTAASAGGRCELVLNSGGSEPRWGRIWRLDFPFDCPPSGTPTLAWDNTCPGPPSFVPYNGISVMSCTPQGERSALHLHSGLGERRHLSIRPEPDHRQPAGHGRVRRPRAARRR
jgi:hypothetical protein